MEFSPEKMLIICNNITVKRTRRCQNTNFHQSFSKSCALVKLSNVFPALLFFLIDHVQAIDVRRFFEDLKCHYLILWQRK